MSLLSSAQGKKIKGLKIGVTDWNLQQTGKFEAVALAKRLGFDGVEVSLGRKPVDGKLPLDNSETQARYLDEAKKHKLHLAGTCLDILHVNYLKNAKLGQEWVAHGIQITRKLDARVMLLPFFGKGALTNHQEMDYVGDALKDLAPLAEKAGIILGLENTISAEDNVRIMDRVRSKALLVYYDVGNSTLGGFDVVKEIRWLGKLPHLSVPPQRQSQLSWGRQDRFPWRHARHRRSSVRRLRQSRDGLTLQIGGSGHGSKPEVH